METTLHHSRMDVSLVKGKRNDTLSLVSRTIMLCLAAKICLEKADAYAWSLSQFPARSSCRLSRVFSSLVSETHVDLPGRESLDVAIVGGGLAGLATAFHLLQKAPNTNITIFDKAVPGCGGASSVAGG